LSRADRSNERWAESDELERRTLNDEHQNDEHQNDEREGAVASVIAPLVFSGLPRMVLASSRSLPS